MAEKSQQMRLRDLRAIYLLVGECCEVGRDPYAWHLRAFEGLRKVLGVQVALAVMSERDLADLRHRDVLGLFGWGWTDAAARQATHEYARLDMQRTDPTFLPFVGLKDELTVRRRKELVSDRQWYRTPHYNDFYRRWRSGDALLVVSHPPAWTGVQDHHVSLYRALGDGEFSIRDRRLATLFFREIRLLLGRKLAPFGKPNIHHLSPRLREVLVLLVDGHSEKQVARELSISRHTTHDYVKQLHRRLGVSSRAELLARGRPLLTGADGMCPSNAGSLPEP